VRTDIWSNKHEKGYNSHKNQPSVKSVYVHAQIMSFVFCRILFIFGILVGHDLSRRILYQFHGWLIFARVKALFMFVWPNVRLHILCTQLVICLLLDFIHIWYLGWPWSEHAHIPISRIVYFCESYSPFHVCLTICPFAHLVYAINHLSFVTFYSYLVSWLAMIWTTVQNLCHDRAGKMKLCVVVLWYPHSLYIKLMCSKVLDYSGT
jgi:hypothetical protein